MTVPPTPIGVLNAEIQQMETSVLTTVRSWWDETAKQFEAKPKLVNPSVQGVYSSLQAAKFDPSLFTVAPNLIDVKLPQIEIDLDTKMRNMVRRWRGRPEVAALPERVRVLEERMGRQQAAASDLNRNARENPRRWAGAARALPGELQRLEERINDLAKALG